VSPSAADKSGYIEVAVALPVHATYTYAVPPPLRGAAAIGKRVLVPFGSRLVTGYVLGDAVDLPAEPIIKDIADVPDDMPLFPESMIALFKWVAAYYFHPLGEVIETALPGGLTLAEQAVYLLTDAGCQKLADPALDHPTRELLNLLSAGPGRFKLLNAKAGGRLTRTMLNQWASKGWVERQMTISGNGVRPKVEHMVHALPPTENNRRMSAQRTAILELLHNGGPMSVAALKDQFPTAAALVRAMAADGQVHLQERVLYRDPLGEPIAPDQAPDLTAEQQQAVGTMAGALGQGFQTFLLAGVTGSGKTEVYLQMTAMALAKGQRVLVLVPEIALISQMERAFRARFGECVALLHSGLSRGERYDQWRRIASGQTPVAIGARSAIFAPLEQLGLIIVDEEHDDSYKQEGALRYNARDLAVVRGQQAQAVVVLGSATPSLQSTYNLHNGKYKPVFLWDRVDAWVMPHIQIEDLGNLTEERGVHRYLSPALLDAMRQTLARREQILLFLNRRGYAGTLVCGTCGQALRCDHCDISLTYHQKINAYTCHYCGLSKAALTRCGRCGSSHIKRLGIGTEKLEAEIQKLFPQARVARMDRDTTRRKGTLVSILRSLSKRQIDILIGTQMVAKGHDYPHITLVGIICADLSLNLPDFRAGERTFQLLAQVAGRAGRGRVPGRVILQTYNPDHFSITAARQQDFEAFYRQESAFRKMLRYPPFTRMVQIRISGQDKKRTAAAAHRLGEVCSRLRSERQAYTAVEVLGPIEAPLSRIADQFRWQLLLKATSAAALHHLVRELVFSKHQGVNRRGVHISLDVDPVFLM
jgi:primosomal protein N' (replication factor Y)